MTVRRILALGTYPIVRPIHGGQRRVAAFKRFYENYGTKYLYACIYDPTHYSKTDVGEDDHPLIIRPSEAGMSNLIGDLMSGRQFELDPPTLQHFTCVLKRINPDAIQVEQPFMWPLAECLRQIANSPSLRLIYSSHNVEAPLKREILVSLGVNPELYKQICAEIGAMEADLCRKADLIVSVTHDDRDYYLQFKEPADVIVVSNGVDRPPKGSQHRTFQKIQDVFKGQPFLMTAGSSHPPNVDGICHYFVDGGIFSVPPVKSIAICGGVSNSVFSRQEYQNFASANSERVEFFPHLDDDFLWAIKNACHGVILPLRGGGGSNLKTAEALALGKWTIATRVALRGFETMVNAKGVIIANDPPTFRRAMREVLNRPPLKLNESDWIGRDTVYWDRCFMDSGVSRVLEL